MRKLCILHETITNKFPRYLDVIISERNFAVNSRSYNRKSIKNIPCNKNCYKMAFFTSTIMVWNVLDFETKSSVSCAIFKNKILNKIRPKKSSYFGLYNNDKVRYLTMLRMGISPLRAKKHKYNFANTSDPYCIVCGCVEDTKHYLLKCISYSLSRTTMMLQNISSIANV